MTDTTTYGIPNWAFYVLLMPIAIFAIWHMNSALIPPPPPPAQLTGKRIVLLIAHPDDESMFFSPTLVRLTAPDLGNHVKVLCLSTGNADGLGETRRKELEAAAVKLGITSQQDVLVLDDPARFKDGMKEQWAERDISNVLAQAFAPEALVAAPGEKKVKKPGKSSSGPQVGVDTLITFDAYGVSSHPNHIALHHGAKAFLTTLMRDHKGYACPVSLYTLSTINILRKYSFALDVLPTYFTGIVSDIVQGASGKKKVARGKGISKIGRQGDRCVFVSALGGYLKGRDAMVNGHRSQMVWFRWGWISLGRYMVVNDLKRVES